MSSTSVSVNSKATLSALESYVNKATSRFTQLRTKLAEEGLAVAQVRFASAQYDGTNDVSVTLSDDGTKATIKASGTAVCFIEFGTGIKYGSGHPMDGELGMGPGTWSDNYGKGHWANEKGWYYGHDLRSEGNPPAMAMYYARNDIIEKVTRVAQEVFA